MISIKEPQNRYFNKRVLDFLASRAAEFGRQIGVKYAEGFTVERTPEFDHF